MFNRYYQEELNHLKELGEAFARAHPALAPMLRGHSADPDVERLLEGVAFLTGLLRSKLDDEFPEIIHEMVKLIWPHYLRPIPSAAVIAFSPKPTLKQSLRIRSGIQLASLPIDGTPCLFQTCYETEIHPLVLHQAIIEQKPAMPPVIKLNFELKGPKLSNWHPERLRLHLGGEFAQAADLYLLLRQHVKKIVFQAADGSRAVSMAPENLRPVGFEEEQALLPFPVHAFAGYRILQEYFILPEKFLFFDLTGWRQWQERGEGSQFDVIFELDELPPSPKRIKADDFVLFATPAVNLFPYEADPIRLDHRQTEYRIRASASNDAHYQVYDVTKVVGYVQGTAQERAYQPFELFAADRAQNPVYHTASRRSPVHKGIDVYLSVIYPPGAKPPATETLSLNLQCTNGFLPEGLQAGDISMPTSTSPEFVDFKNLGVPTAVALPPLGSNLLWRMLSHLSLNYLSLQKAENLKALLHLYIFQEGRDQPKIIANQKRVEGIVSVRSRAADRLVADVMVRGREIELGVRRDHFACLGDLYLFASVLENFMGNYASINTFTRMILKESLSGAIYRWPARIGEHYLV